MRKQFLKILPIVTATVAIFFGVHQAHAQVAAAAAGAITNLIGSTNMWDFAMSLLAEFVNAVLMITSFLVTASAAILNVSIVLTLHIRDFVDSTPAIYTIWQTIRDISGLFFIFMILWAAFQTILDAKTTHYKEMLFSIITVGILVNFSFFILSVGIDASNVVSQAIYNAMIPNQPVETINNTTTLQGLVSNEMGISASGQPTAPKADLASVFTNSLKIPSLYNTAGTKVGQTISNPVKIIIIGAVGIIIMLTTAGSFLLAAGAFTARLVVLLFLLAFSPIIFLGKIFPQIGKQFDFEKEYFNQLIFMPVYLLLMYAGLSVLNNSHIIGAANASFSIDGATGTNWALPFIVLAVNCALVVIMLNLPLMVGLKMGGMATSWMGNKLNKWDAFKIWKNVGGKTGSQLGNRTLGRAAYALNQSRMVASIAKKSPTVGGIVSSGLTKVSSASFGEKKGSYEDRLKAKKKAEEAMHKRIGTVERTSFAPGDAGKEAYEEAKKQAKKDQEEYRGNLPWNNPLIGFVLDNRAHREAAEKLDKDAKKADTKEKKKTAIEERKKNDTRLNELHSEKSAIEEQGRTMTITLDEAKKTRLEAIEKKRKELIDNNKRRVETLNKEETALKEQKIVLTGALGEAKRVRLEAIEKERSELIEKNNVEIEALNAEEATLKKQKATLPAPLAESHRTRLEAIEKERRELMAKNESLKEDIDKGKAVEDEEKEEKHMSRFDDIERKIGSGGEGKKDGEKK